MTITFLQFLAENKKVEFQTSKFDDKSVSSTHRSENHEAKVFYTHTYDNRYAVDFDVDGEAHGSNKHIPAHHKHKLMMGVGHSLNHFVKSYKPKKLSLGVDKTDPDYKRKRKQYRTAAEILAKKHGGTDTHDEGGSYITF
jgi:hypothetical protein